MNKLVTIKFSHYNEKARWALDRCGIPYTESPHLPVTHMPFAARAARGQGSADRVSTRFSTPVLMVADRSITDSSDIARYATAHPDSFYDLVPEELEAEIAELDELFSVKLGAHTRRFAYYYCLQDKKLFARLAPLNVPGFESTLWQTIYPALRVFLRWGLAIDEPRALHSTTRTREIFAEVDDLLADGRRYLVGDRFTLADLSFASLSGPALLVEDREGYDARLPTMDEAPPEMAAVARELRESPAGKFALRLFAEERSRQSAGLEESA